MSDIAIRIENLSKAYRISHQTELSSRSRYKTLQGDIIALPNKFISSIRHERKTQETYWALKEITFNVRIGEMFGIIGANGAGKSTLLKILSQITEPTQGRIELYGRAASLLEVDTGFHPELTGRENIFLSGAILGMTRSEIKRKFEEIVDFSGVEQFIDTPVKRYSSGMYMRLAFAVAAHLEPDILLVDEVLAVGDAEFQKKCLGKMGEVAHGGRTVLFVSHNMAAIKSLCDNGILIENGMIKRNANIKLVIEGYYNTLLSRFNAIPLGEREDRTGGDLLRFTSCVVSCSDSQETQFLTCGGDGKISIKFYSSNSYLANLRFGIVFIEKITGLALLEFNSYYVTDEIMSCRKGVGKFTFEFKKFPLSAGDYLIGIIATSGLDILDWVKEADTVTVIEGNFFYTGRMPQNKGVLFFHDCDCYLEGSNIQ